MAESSQEKELVLSPSWEEWLTEALLSGQSLEEIFPLLLERGLSQEQALEAITGLLQNPVFRAAERIALKLRRADLYTRLLRHLERDFGAESLVDRRPGISAKEFYHSYVLRNQPLVIPKMAASWKAVHLWTPTYLKQKYGDAEIEMMDGREGDPLCDQNYKAHQRKTTLGAFVEKVEAAEGDTNDFYLVANNRNIDREPLCHLLDDVEMDESFFDPKKRESYHSFWFGPKGTQTPLHHDTTNILFFQIYGQKRVRLISPLEIDLLSQLRNFYSEADCDETPPALLSRFPSVAIKEVILRPGDGLFLPAGWWHQVRSLSISINLSFMNLRFPNNFDWYAPGKILSFAERFGGL